MIILTITMMRRSIYAMEIDMIHITPTGNYARMMARHDECMRFAKPLQDQLDELTGHKLDAE